MLKIGKLTDYAVVLMAQLARDEPPAPRSAAYLAGKTGVPEPTVGKILKHLAKGNVVDSLRGAAGGYKLTRPATEISVAEIVVAMDGPIAVVSCVENSHDACRSEAHCPVRGNWDHANTLIRQALESIKLSDMMGAPCRKSYDFIQSAEVGAHVGNE